MTYMRNPGARQRQAKTFRTLHTALFALHTPHFTLALHTSSHLKACELFSPHLSSSHLIPPLLTCHQSKSTVFISSEHWSTFLPPRSCSNLISAVLHARKLLTVRQMSLAQKNIGRRKFLHTDTWGTNAFRQKSLSEILCTTKLAQSISQHYFALSKLAQSTSQYYFVLQSLHKALPSTTLYYKACTKHVPVLICTTKLAQSTSQYYFVLRSLHKVLPSTTLHYKACTKHVQYYFVLQDLHKARPSTTLYYKACTKYFPVLLCATKLAQSTSQCYFVLQSLHKALPSTTLYYKAYTKHFPAILCSTQSLHPALLCTAKLAQSTSQYYFVPRSLRKAFPSTFLYYKACTKYVPVLLCETKFAQIKLLHTASSFAEKLLHTARCYTQPAFAQRSFYT